MTDFSRQLEAVIKKYPFLVANVNQEGYLLTGTIEMNAIYNEIPLYDKYEIEMKIPHNFPLAIPIVKELNGKVPKGLQHFLEDGSLCLGAPCELYDYLGTHGTILEFIDDIVISYLYTCSYFIRYRTIPYGERSHGIQGIIEAFMERYAIKSEQELFPLLAYVTGLVKYRGHELCPCGSGQKLRRCHGKKSSRILIRQSIEK